MNDFANMNIVWNVTNPSVALENSALLPSKLNKESQCSPEGGNGCDDQTQIDRLVIVKIDDEKWVRQTEWFKAYKHKVKPGIKQHTQQIVYGEQYNIGHWIGLNLACDGNCLRLKSHKLTLTFMLTLKDHKIIILVLAILPIKNCHHKLDSRQSSGHCDDKFVLEQYMIGQELIAIERFIHFVRVAEDCASMKLPVLLNKFFNF